MTLVWSGPAGCPTTENVQARVDALLGGEASASSVADVRASGQVERQESGFRLQLNMGVGSSLSSRVIEARTCDELAGAAAIAIALLARSTLGTASDVSATDSTNAAATSGASSGEEPAPPHTDAATEPGATKNQQKYAESAPSGVRLVLDAPIGLVGWGSLPGVAVGLAAGAGLRWRAVRVVATAELWQPRTAYVSGFAARFTLQSARAQACFSQPAHGLELAPCVGVAVQRLAGAGVASEVFSAKSHTDVWVAGTGGLFASVPAFGFEHLRFFGEALVVVSPVRPRFFIEQLGLVHEPALAAPRLDLGCEWIF